MAHPLDGARLKIARAQEHVDALKTEIGAYIETVPYEGRLNPYQDRISGKVETFPSVDIVVPPPPHLRLLVGDCVANIRTALDYIMWELAVRYFRPTLNKDALKDLKLTYFPISRSRKHMDAVAKRGIPTAAMSEVEAVQPNNRGYEPLQWVSSLANIDKHRMPLLLLSEVPSYCFPCDAEGNVLDSRCRKLKTSELPDGRIKMHMDRQFPVSVALNEFGMPRDPIDVTLAQIIKTAADIIPRFDQFF